MHMVAGHMGEMSIALSQIGCICPLTHWHVHPAQAEDTLTSSIITVMRDVGFIPQPLLDSRPNHHEADREFACKP